MLVERTTASGPRLGLVAAVDLERYDYAPGTRPPVRPTEQTIPERLPPRLAIRRGAPLELSHILILIDDPERTVLEPLRAKKDSLEKLYDFERLCAGSALFRCSKSMILNADKIDYVRPSLSGRFEAVLSNGEKVVVSRKYVADLKRMLGV